MMKTRGSNGGEGIGDRREPAAWLSNRSGQPIRFGRLPGVPGDLWVPVQHGPAGWLLRQRRHGKLLLLKLVHMLRYPYLAQNIAW